MPLSPRAFRRCILGTRGFKMASGASSLEEQVIRSAVRSAVREELSSRSGSQSLVERTRQLISASVSSASRALKEASALSVEDTKLQTKRQHSVPSHSLRFKKRLSNQRKCKSSLKVFTFYRNSTLMLTRNMV